MKKLVFATAALFVFLSFAHAQNVKWGVEAGANMGAVDGGSNGSTNYFQTSHTIGFQAGPYVEYQFSDLIGIQPELLFNELNTIPNTVSGTWGEFANPNSTIHLNYLSLPILVRFNLSKAFSLQVGPQFGMLLQNETFYNNGASIDAFKKPNIGGTVAAQFDLGYWLIYGRFNMGFNNINNCTEDSKWHTHQYQLGIGYDLTHFHFLHKK